jgi:hypothetical protein
MKASAQGPSRWLIFGWGFLVGGIGLGAFLASASPSASGLCRSLGLNTLLSVLNVHDLGPGCAALVSLPWVFLGIILLVKGSKPSTQNKP